MRTRTKLVDTNSVRTSVETISPFEAEEILKFNNINRPLRKRGIRSFSQQMTAGNWRVNGQGIIISKTGTLLDGQHRLFGVIESGKPLETVLITGVEDSVFDTIDTGKARSNSDIFYIGGADTVKSPVIAPAISLDMTIKHTGTLNTGSLSYSYPDLATPHSLLLAYEANKDKYDDAYEFVMEYPRFGLPISRANLTTLAYRMFEIDRNFSEKWLHGFITGEMLKANDYRLWIRELINREKTGNVKRSRKVLNLITIKAWYYTKTKRAKVKNKPSLFNVMNTEKKILQYIQLDSDVGFNNQMELIKK